MTKILLSAAVAAIALSATPAAAQTAPGGARFEALLGWDRIKVPGDHYDGLLYGVGAGYDVPVGSAFSIGADGEVTFSNANENFGGVVLEAGRDLYAGLRGTFAVTPKTNLYAKAGYTNARARAVGDFDLDGDTETVSDNDGGWRVGVGVQHALTDATYIGAEYRYSRYNDTFKRHQLAATVGVRFWQPAAAVAPAPVVEAPAPAPAAPATQTCADGSVILATDVCPAPAPVPAPAPAPAPAGERG